MVWNRWEFSEPLLMFFERMQLRLGSVCVLLRSVSILSPSIIDLAPMEMELLSRASREKILDRALKPVRGSYDFILIDCPPQLSILTINAHYPVRMAW